MKATCYLHSVEEYWKSHKLKLSLDSHGNVNYIESDISFGIYQYFNTA